MTLRAGQQAWDELSRIATGMLRRSPKSIRGRLVALTVGLFLVFIWILVYASVTVVQRKFDEVLLEQQFAATRQVAAEIDNKLEERIQFLSRAARFVPPDLAAPALDAFLAQRTSLQVVFSGGMAVIGPDGRFLAGYPVAPGAVGADFGNQESFRRVLATGKPYIDKPVLDQAQGRPMLTIAVPVLDQKGEVRAVLTGIADLAAPGLLGLLTDRGMTGAGEYLIFSRQDKLVIAATDRERRFDPMPERGINPVLDRFVDGFEGSGFGVNTRGVPTLYSAKQAHAANWVVLAALPTDVARRPVTVLQYYVYAVAGVITLLAVLILLWLTRRVLAPLEEAGTAMRRMTAGDQPLAPLTVESPDEVGQLIGNFNRLVEERQRYEAALEASELRFRLLVESAPDAIFVQVRGRFAYVNEATLSLFGAHSKEQLLGMPCVDRLHPDSRAEVLERIQAINTAKKSSPPLEERYLRFDGSEATVEVSAVPFRYGNEDGALVFVRDLTERKRGEQALKALNRDFVALLENTSDFIYFKDQDSRFRFCSQTLARITGHRHWRDMIGKHDLEVFPPDTAKIYYEEELPIFREGKALLDRIDPYYDEDGNPGWVSTNKWPVFGDDGRTVVGIFGISRIVTERVRAEAKLVAANKELQSFTYAASHDLKAPLGRINSFSTLLERNYRDSLEGDGLLFLDFIRRNATRMTVLIDDLLAHAQIEQKILDTQPLSVEEMVEAALREKEEDIRQGRVEIRLDLPRATVMANPHGMGQVLRNLLENALKYSSQAERPTIEICGELRDDRCRLWVRDNGIGFDMAYHDRIFEIFRRLHTYEEFPGSGVGLALVRKAVEKMGGKVWAESRPGEGATFFVELAGAPAACLEEATEDSQPA